MTKKRERNVEPLATWRGTPVGYRATWNASGRSRPLKSLKGANAYLDAAEARFDEANKLADGEIWTSIDIIYEGRWDCPTVRLAAAQPS